MLARLRGFLRRKARATTPRLIPESEFVVTTTYAEITVCRPDRRVEQISFPELEAVIIETNDTGPWGMDFWWILAGASGGCTFPQGATGENDAIERLQKLPGFDNEALIAATGSTGNARFVCWRRASS
jgi:hypothetical protein